MSRPSAGLLALALLALGGCIGDKEPECPDLNGESCEGMNEPGKGEYWMCDECGTSWRCSYKYEVWFGSDIPCECISEDHQLIENDTGWRCNLDESR